MEMEILELLASAYAPQRAWHECEKCHTEYNSVRRAWACYKSHFRSYERVYVSLDTEAVKHEVVFVEGLPFCGTCARKAEGDSILCIVRVESPPNCGGCGRPIRDKPLPEIHPNILPHSERHHDLILHPSKEAETNVMRLSWHRALKRAGLNSIGAQGTFSDPEVAEKFNAAGRKINGKLFKDFGPCQQVDGNGGLLRTESGYIEVAQKEKVEIGVKNEN